MMFTIVAVLVLMPMVIMALALTGPLCWILVGMSIMLSMWIIWEN